MPCRTREKKDGETYVICYGAGYPKKAKAKAKTKPKAKPKVKPKLKAPKTTPSKIKTSVKPYGAGKKEFKKPVEFIIKKSKEKEFVKESEKQKKHEKKYPGKKIIVQVVRINEKHKELKWVEPTYNILDKYKLLEPKNDRFDRVRMIDWKKAPIKLKDDLKELKKKYDDKGLRKFIGLLRTPINAEILIEREMEEADLDELTDSTDEDAEPKAKPKKAAKKESKKPKKAKKGVHYDDPIKYFEFALKNWTFTPNTTDDFKFYLKEAKKGNKSFFKDLIIDDNFFSLKYRNIEFNKSKGIIGDGPWDISKVKGKPKPKTK